MSTQLVSFLSGQFKMFQILFALNSKANGISQFKKKNINMASLELINAVFLVSLLLKHFPYEMLLIWNIFSILF